MRRAALQPGEKVLILDAGGSIGAHASLIAEAMVAEVTAVDSGAEEGLARRLGADHFVDYTKADVTAAGKRYDVVFDVVPRGSFGASMRSLTENGRYFAGNATLWLMVRALFTSRFSRKTASVAMARETKEELLALKEMVEAGNRRVETEERRGAVVIEIGDTERARSRP